VPAAEVASIQKKESGERHSSHARIALDKAIEGLPPGYKARMKLRRLLKQESAPHDEEALAEEL
jgi:hypothetical protein